MIYNLGILLLVVIKIVVIFGQELSEKEYEMIKISIEDSELLRNVSEDEYKAILRYGFHRTDACQNFEKAFVCIKKCLNAGFEIGESDKKCQCRCYKNRVLAAHKSTSPVNGLSTKITAPTTSRPSWVKLPPGEVKPKSDKELFADLTPDGDESGSGNDDSGIDHDGGSGKGDGGSGDAPDGSGVTETATEGGGKVEASGEGATEAGGEAEAEAGGDAAEK